MMVAIIKRYEGICNNNIPVIFLLINNNCIYIYKKK